MSQAIDTHSASERFSQSGAVSWEELQTCISQAKSSYQGKSENSKLRGWIREGDVVVATLERLSSMIPDQNGLSVLRGALAYIFQVSHVSHILPDIIHVLTFITRRGRRGLRM